MAKRIDEELFDRLRANGLRKRVARTISEAAGAGRTAGGRGEAAVRGAITDLRKLADELEDRLSGGTKSRSAAAQKAARTRATAARKRSTAAKKAAATRAKNARTTTSRSTSSRSKRSTSRSGTRAKATSSK